MNNRRVLLSASSIAIASCLFSSHETNSATIQTLGSGSAVSVVQLSATFDSLTSNNVVHLETYQESALRVLTSGDSWAADLNMSAKLDPFHGATAPDRAFYATAWGNEDWVTIQTTNLAKIHGIELTYGNTWTTGDIYGPYPWGKETAFLEWQTFNNGNLVSSGQTGPPLAPGAVIGFYDPVGFDQLLVRCRIENSVPIFLQAMAMDNLQVMVSNVPPAPLIYGDDLNFDPITAIPSLTVYDTIAGCQYRMVYSDTLSPASWIAVTPPLPGGWKPGGGALVFTDVSAAGSPHRFYRVEVR